MNSIQALIASVVIGVAAHALPVIAAEAAPSTPATASEPERVRALLDKAEAHLREKGDTALADFSTVGTFHDGDLYVYVMDTEGMFLASGGSSAALIGQNVRDMTDVDGRHFFRDMLERARRGESGRVEYRWYNPVRGRSEPKSAEYRVVGDRVVAVGYYSPAASIELAKSLLWRAVHQLKQDGKTAFERFNRLDGGFVTDDLYVFVIGIEDGLVHAHGGSPRQVGRDATVLVDANGRNFGNEMIELARSQGEADIRYAWRNPVSGKVERKHSYIVRVGDYLVGVGAYEGPAR